MENEAATQGAGSGAPDNQTPAPGFDLNSAVEAELALLQGQEGEPEQDEGEQDEQQPDDQQDEQEEEAPVEVGEGELEHVAANGKKYVIPRELHEGYLRQQDYTQNMQALSERSRQADARDTAVQELYQGGQHTQQLRSELAQIEAGIAAGYQNLAQNPNLANDDAVLFAKITGQMTMLQHARAAAQQQIGDAERKFKEYNDRQDQERVARVMPVLQKIGLDAPALQRIASYAQANGFTAEEVAYLGAARAPHALVTMEKARRYDELMAQRAKATTKVDQARRSQVLKPGNATVQKQPSASVGKASQRLTATGAINDAVALELSLMERGTRGRR